MNMPPVPRADIALVTLGGLLLVLAAVVAGAREATPAWGKHQDAARVWVRQRHGDDDAAKLPRGLQQVWIPALHRVDRCTTCHVATDGGVMTAEAPQPWRSHPHPELLAAHPVERFGCTLCHGGQGQATTQASAHGEVPFWEEPLLDTARAMRAGLERRQLLEMRCNRCHQHQQDVEGLPTIAEGRRLVEQLRCVRCHAIQGEGGTTGPDLTHVGDEPPSKRHFPHGFQGPRTALAWHVEHLLDPQAMSPGSAMPKLALDHRQATAIALLLMSWQRVELPAAWTPR